MTAPREASPPTVVFTVGHSSHPIEVFLGLLAPGADHRTPPILSPVCDPAQPRICRGAAEANTSAEALGWGSRPLLLDGLAFYRPDEFGGRRSRSRGHILIADIGSARGWRFVQWRGHGERCVAPSSMLTDRTTRRAGRDTDVRRQCACLRRARLAYPSGAVPPAPSGAHGAACGGARAPRELAGAPARGRARHTGGASVRGAGFPQVPHLWRLGSGLRAREMPGVWARLSGGVSLLFILHLSCTSWTLARAGGCARVGILVQVLPRIVESARVEAQRAAGVAALDRPTVHAEFARQLA